ncbi:Formin-like protein 3 [Diplonema papillatum]|nr:Formin-like protein 3 [Diplonema papillatum]
MWRRLRTLFRTDPVEEPSIVRMQWPGVEEVFILQVGGNDPKASLKGVAKWLDKEMTHTYMILNMTDTDFSDVFARRNIVKYGNRYGEDFLFLLDTCHTIDRWLRYDDKNRAILITQLNGYDLAPLVATSLLIFRDRSGQLHSDAMRAFDVVKKMGVNIQAVYEESFKRYVIWFALLFVMPKIPCEFRVCLTKLQVVQIPAWASHTYDLVIHAKDTSSGEWKSVFTSDDNSTAVVASTLEIPLELPLLGDLVIMFTVPVPDNRTGKIRREPLFRFTFSTLFLQNIPTSLQVPRSVLDFASQKLSHIVPDTFHLVLDFGPCVSTTEEQKEVDTNFVRALVDRVDKAPAPADDDDTETDSDFSDSDAYNEEQAGLEAAATTGDENDYIFAVKKSGMSVELAAVINELKGTFGETVDATFQEAAAEMEKDKRRSWRRSHRASTNDGLSVRSGTPPDVSLNLSITGSFNNNNNNNNQQHTPHSSRATLGPDTDLGKIFEDSPSLKKSSPGNLRRSFAGGPTTPTTTNGAPASSPTPQPPPPPAPVTMPGIPPGKGHTPAPAPPPPPGKGPPPPPPRAPGVPPPPPGKGPPPPPPPLGGKGPPPPPGLPGAPGAGPKTNMKVFHWKKVKQVNVQQNGTLWGELQNKKAAGAMDVDVENALDLDLLQKMFEKKKAEKKKDDKKKSKTKQSFAIAGPRAQNIGIVLSFLKLTPDEIMDAVLTCDATKLHRDALEGLQSIVPQEDEVKALNHEKKDTPDIVWGPPEHFCHLVGNNIPDLADRLRQWILTMDFSKQIGEISAEMNTYDEALETLLSKEGKFAKILEIVLTVGNTMNKGTAHGGAVGFSMENLGQLSNVKSNDGEASLMDFVVMSVVAKAPHLESFTSELRPVAAARSTSISDIARGVQLLKQEFAAIKGRASSDADDAFTQLLRNFVASSQVQIDSAVKRSDILTSRTGDLARFYGEDVIGFDPAVFFSQIVGFSQEFEQSAKAMQEKKVREQRKLEREAKKKADLSASMAELASTQKSEQSDLDATLRSEASELEASRCATAPMAAEKRHADPAGDPDK